MPPGPIAFSMWENLGKVLIISSHPMNTTLVAATLSPFDQTGRPVLIFRQHIVWLREYGIQVLPRRARPAFLYLSWEERKAIHQAVIEAARGVVIPCVWDPTVAGHRLAKHAADSGPMPCSCLPLFHVVEKAYPSLVRNHGSKYSIPV